jgi:ABC-type multidrug transport system fused ATPase/permease subunit
LTPAYSYDKILVLGEGSVLEYDTPANLLADDASHFTALCRQAGEAEYNKLKSMVKPAS